MDHHQQELRHAAAQAFIASLDQLADCLEDPTAPASNQTLNQEQPASTVVNAVATETSSLQALAAAAADIEAFMQANATLRRNLLAE
ncbi:MAG: hypothetical protein EDM05_014480 [Leptolyngbya sp. IPPAS B-1204]|nr:hypothetical protein [Elainella sp. C42_A2020_010]RNJ65158.1 MAG: hypothetical protein EDM05_32725 [Leptolyngbya sp. IPPAS B-1204]